MDNGAVREKTYISGPMTGYEELNFPAFQAAADRLRQSGIDVISPHEVEQPILKWSSCMRNDIKVLMDCERVAVLPGWEQSKGARIEVDLAHKLGMPIVCAITLVALPEYAEVSHDPT